MNVQRMLLGGVLAGVFLVASEGILNGVILMDEYQAMTSRYGIVEASWAMPAYIATTFVLGLVLAWLYAATRPRFGAGARTGAIAGFAMWIMAYAVPSVWMTAMGMAMGAGSTLLALVWGLAELMLGGVIAGWAYREEGAA